MSPCLSKGEKREWKLEASKVKRWDKLFFGNKDFKGMTRVGRRLIEDFLLPALNSEKYGDLLKWIDREKLYFSIRWSHKNAAKWSLEDTAVFQDWDKLKGHYRPDHKGYYMQAKQRFRAALYKLNTVRKLPCDDKHVKKYQLVLENDKRKSVDCINKSRSRISSKRDECQKSIPTPVICKNTSYIAKSPSPSLSPPPVASQNESSDKKEELLSIDYSKKLEELQQQQMLLEQDCQSQCVILTKDEPMSFETDEDAPKTNCTANRAPHVPIQPLPVYTSKCAVRQQTAGMLQRRYESPNFFLVPTYNELYVDTSNVKDEVIPFDEKCVSEVALNLSTKPTTSIAIMTR